MLNNCSKVSQIISPLSLEDRLSLRENLKCWFLKQKRDLPWRHKRDPYATWIAEVMLQQTLSAVVIPYFNRWMELFPTLEALAQSPIDLVLKTWEGLGYYSRAKNLHEGAKYILENLNGIFPDTEVDLLKIKGIGPYTSKAILSFAFGRHTSPIDGNVARVIARVFALGESIETTQSKKIISQSADSLDPDPIIAEALIELGATVCQKKANCSICPIKSSCLAFRHHLQATLPIVKKRTPTTHLQRLVAVVLVNDHFLVKSGQKGKVMEHLFEFPYLEGQFGLNDLQTYLASLGLKISLSRELEETSHSFTRYKAHLSPFLFEAENMCDIEGHLWIKNSEIIKIPFSSGHRKILQEVNLRYTCV